MNCPRCGYKKNIVAQISVAMSGHFICSNCSTVCEVKSKREKAFDWLIELLLIPLGVVSMIIFDIHFVFVIVYLILLFLLWFLVARGAIKAKLMSETKNLSTTPNPGD